MIAAIKILCYLFVTTLLLGGGLFVNTHREWLRSQIRLAVEHADEATPPAPGSKSGGRHALTESPPVTVADLDRLVSVGFTPDQVVSEIERRGVLHLPEPTEREHIQTLPSGSRLLDAMDSPKNLLEDSAAARYGQRQAGAPNFEQLRSMQASAAQQAVFRNQAGLPATNARQQQSADYQRRLNALSLQIYTLKQKRAAMQRRGEVTAAITIEIDRLEREKAALVPPL